MASNPIDDMYVYLFPIGKAIVTASAAWPHRNLIKSAA